MRHNDPVIDYTDPATASQRLSHSERDDAVAALSEFAAEGRLTEAEAKERSDTARSAVTRGDLAPLFADLPTANRTDAPQQSGPPAQQSGFGAQNDAGYGPGAYGPGGYGYPPSRSGRSWRYAIMSLSPFVALALFFITGNIWGFNYAWLWFLIIPIAGIFTYGAGGWGDHDRYR